MRRYIGCLGRCERQRRAEPARKGQDMAEGLAKDDLSGYLWRSSFIRHRTVAVPHRKSASLPYASGMRHARIFPRQAAG